jgi:hypothetical protein
MQIKPPLPKGFLNKIQSRICHFILAFFPCSIIKHYSEMCVSGVSVSLMSFDVRLPLPVVCGTEPVNVCVCLLAVSGLGKKVGYT